MTDKELLEFAAKAAGITLDWFGDDTPAIKNEDENIDPAWAFLNPWNPLTNDGDAFRLAVAVGLNPFVEITIAIGDGVIDVETSLCSDQHKDICINAHAGGLYDEGLDAAMVKVRRAIVESVVDAYLATKP